MNPTDTAWAAAGSPWLTVPDLCIVTGRTPRQVLDDLWELHTARRLASYTDPAHTQPTFARLTPHQERAA